MASKFVARTLFIALSILLLGTTACAQIPPQSNSPVSQGQTVPKATEKVLPRTPDVIYVPTPMPVVAEMLRVANVQPQDLVYDLGSGDGRIVIAAAKLGARGIGVDIDPQRIKEANANAKTAGVTDRVQFRQEDLFQTDLTEATVVTLYLLQELNLKLRPKLFRELKPGTRVVSHAFNMGDWKPEKVIQIGDRVIYYWVIPEKLPPNFKP